MTNLSAPFGPPDTVVRAARLLDGRVVDIWMADGRIAALTDWQEELSTGHNSVLDAGGSLVTTSFVNAHLHLDKVYTLPFVGDRAISAYTDGDMAGAAEAIDIARAVKIHYGADALLLNVCDALNEGLRYGSLDVLAFADVDTAARLEGVKAVLAARERFRGRIEIQVVAFPQDGLIRDPGAAELCEEALRMGADVVGGIPWIEETEADAAEHVEWACELAARTGRRVAMLVDDAGDAALRTTEMLASAMLRHGLVGRGIACHARATALYSQSRLQRLIELAQRAGLAFVADPHTGPLALPVRQFVEAGLPVALGQDDIEDAYYPYGRNNLLEVAFLGSHLLEMRTSADQLQLLDLVTTQAARVLGLDGHNIAPGAPANLCVHKRARVVDLLREHEAPRWVISAGQVVAETETTTTFFWRGESGVSSATY